MASLHQRPNQENVHERESACERHQSRWSTNTRVIVDGPPSQPLSRQQSSRSVKESHHKDPGTGIARHVSATGRLQGSNPKWSSSSGVIIDTPPSQPLSSYGVPLLGSSPTVHHYNRSDAEEALSVGSIRVVRDGVRVLKPPLKRHRLSKDPLGLRRSFARGQNQNYPQLLQKLIVQGLFKLEGIEENEVTVFCHVEDEATVKKVLPAAVKEYVEIMKPVLHGVRLRIRVRCQCVPVPLK
jgi:hypothetical protein